MRVASLVQRRRRHRDKRKVEQLGAREARAAVAAAVGVRVPRRCSAPPVGENLADASRGGGHGHAHGVGVGALVGARVGARVGGGVRHVDATHTPLAQSAPTPHARAWPHAGHEPPQSTSVSSPFSRLSVHPTLVGLGVGAGAGSAVGSGVGLGVGRGVGGGGLSARTLIPKARAARRWKRRRGPGRRTRGRERARRRERRRRGHRRPRGRGRRLGLRERVGRDVGAKVDAGASVCAGAGAGAAPLSTAPPSTARASAPAWARTSRWSRR